MRAGRDQFAHIALLMPMLSVDGSAIASTRIQLAGRLPWSRSPWLDGASNSVAAIAAAAATANDS